MVERLIDEEKLKSIFKKAIVEVLEERRELLRSLLDEAIEDLALARAIEQGESSGFATRQEVLGILEGQE
jgi:ribosomal protein L12E/L44/L45/RPP1/RPP2